MESKIDSVIMEAAAYVGERLAGGRPQVGIILGSGLGKLADAIDGAVTIPYRDIPGFPVSTAIGHKGNFIYGKLSGRPVLAMQGRFHSYEGYSMGQVTLPVRVMSQLGVGTLFVSNAAGGLDDGLNVGDLMIITDHINMIPNPLVGPNEDTFGPRFPDMTHPYDLGLIAEAKAIASQEGIPVHEGVYIAVTGPSYETVAEMLFFKRVGADAVGMSTVPEVIVARHCGMRVFGMSVITDTSLKEKDSDFRLDGEAVVRAADAAADEMTVIFSKLLLKS